MSTIKILIVEDELLIAEDLKTKLVKMGYEITATVDNSVDALRMVHANPPDIVLMDIQLKGEIDGIELSKKIKQVDDIPIIFLSNLDDNTTVGRAKDTTPSAYILKPFRPRELNIAIEIAISKLTRHIEKEVHHHQEKSSYLLDDRIFIKDNFTFHKVYLSDIFYLKADGSYTEIKTRDKTYILSETLNNFQEKLPFKQFVRMHRTWLINVDKIDSFQENAVVIKDTEIPIGKTYRQEFKRRFRFI
ncbi:MAG: response regulator [Bacteroidota bacterium]